MILLQRNLRFFTIIMLLTGLPLLDGVVANNVAPAVSATKKAVVQNPSFIQHLKNVASSAYENRTAVVGVGLSALAVSYIGYAAYLDCKLNGHNCLWHWATHHMRDGFFESFEIMDFIHSRYADLETIHPLTAVFAATHDVEMEIQDCLKLRGMIQTLKAFRLNGLISEGITTLDKKIENLYLLKIALLNYTAETRSRCKRRAAVIS